MRALLVIATLALTASACAPVYYVDDETVYAPVAPPPLRAEPVYGAPGPGYVWVPGHWYWTGRDYVWQAGYWSRPPAVGQVWVRAGWAWHDGRYRYVPGRWAPVTARPRPSYYHPPRHRPAPPPHVNRPPHDSRPRDTRPPPPR